VQITGVLVMAAGIPRAFGGDFTIAVIGYLIMRAALTFQWLRAASGETGAPRRGGRDGITPAKYVACGIRFWLGPGSVRFRAPGSPGSLSAQLPVRSGLGAVP